MAIGNFDGVHRGHQQLINGVIARARLRGMASVVVTFDPHPLAVVRPEAAPVLLTDRERRVELLRDTGIERVVVLPFSPEISRWGPSEFAHRVLGTALGAVEVHVGENFRFGHRAAGDAAMLGRIGSAYGFTVHAMPLAGAVTPWSSTAVRRLLARGEVEAAAAVLGRPHRLAGVLAPASGDGERIFQVDTRLALPAEGIYMGRLVSADGRRPGVEIFIGTGGPDHPRVKLRGSDGTAVGPGRNVVAVDVMDRV